MNNDPRTSVKLAECVEYPLYDGYTMIVDFQNWDPEKDGQASLFEEILRVKFGKDNIRSFWWKKFPSKKTRFTFDVPYPVGDRLKKEKYTLVSDAIFEYSGSAKIQTMCWPA